MFSGIHVFMKTWDTDWDVAVGGTLQDRVRRSIQRDIESGKYAPGDRLLAEREIAESMGVSVVPVRAALDQLAQRSIVVRRQGKGTFVNDQRVQYRLESWKSCTEDLREQGIEFGVRVLTLADEVPPAHVADALEIDPQAEAVHLLRIIVIKDKPAILMASWTRGITASSIGSAEDFAAGRSLYHALAEEGITLVEADTTIDVNLTGEFESAVLEVPYATPVLQVTGVAHCEDGPREWSRLTYLGSLFSLRNKRVIGSSPASELNS